jgi:phage terminase small subunit
MARPRKPTNVLILKGAGKKDPQRLRAREGEPENINPTGDPPKHLEGAELAAWGELVGMAIPGVLGEADRMALEVASVLIAKFRAKEISGPELSQLTKLLSQFGMTPADRSKINLPGKKKKNAFDDD